MTYAQLDAYQTVQTTTTDPARLVILLFDGASRFLHQAERALERGDGAGFARAVSRAHAIIGELAGSLNPEVGGEMAQNLSRLYDFMLRHLTQGLVAKNPRHLVEVGRLLRTIQEGFEGAIAQVGAARGARPPGVGLRA